MPLAPMVSVLAELMETGPAGLVNRMPLMLKACDSQLLRLAVEGCCK